MLLHDQMDCLLHCASRPEMRIEKLFCFGEEKNYGWEAVIKSAMYPYIALNIIYLKHNTWPTQSSSSDFAGVDKTENNLQDYRLTAFYQRAVEKATSPAHIDAERLPHRQFFGQPEEGLKPMQELLGRQYLPQYLGQQMRFHVPNSQDVSTVKTLLGSAGNLSTELADTILDLADYRPQSRLSVLHDPMYPENSKELRKYLSYCWKLLIRCDCLATACGYSIDWEAEVQEAIAGLTMDFTGVENRWMWCDQGTDARLAVERELPYLHGDSGLRRFT
ncbi:hypothetical protein LTR86_011175, partial [Recurvomyces mirabilis]